MVGDFEVRFCCNNARRNVALNAMAGLHRAVEGSGLSISNKQVDIVSMRRDHGAICRLSHSSHGNCPPIAVLERKRLA